MEIKILRFAQYDRLRSVRQVALSATGCAQYDRLLSVWLAPFSTTSSAQYDLFLCDLSPSYFLKADKYS